MNFYLFSLLTFAFAYNSDADASNNLSSSNITSISNIYGKGADFYSGIIDNLTAGNANVTISCLKSKGFDAVFLYIYNPDDRFDDDSANLIRNLKKNDFHIEYVVYARIPGSQDAKALVDDIMQRLNAHDAHPSFLWFNVLRSVGDPAGNIQYLQSMRKAAQNYNLGIGIITIPSLWDSNYNNWTQPALENDILWVDVTLDNFGDFKSFGGWKHASVISPPGSVECALSIGNLSYVKSDLESHRDRSVMNQVPNMLLILLIILCSFV